MKKNKSNFNQMDSPCVAFNQKWDVWICSKHPAVEKRTNCFLWAPPSRINSQDPEKSLKEYETFVLSSPLKTKLLPSLYGKTFGCWCYRGGPCHGRTLAALARKAYESQLGNNGILKRESIPQSFYQFTTTPQPPQTFLFKQPKFISCFIDHQRTGNSITVEEISQPITTQPLKEPLLIPISEDTYFISLGPHKIRPLITYQLNNDTRYSNVIALCNELLEKLDKDISFYGLGLSNLTIHSTRELTSNDEKKPNNSITLLLPNDNSSDAIVDDPLVDSESMCVIHTLLITTRDSNEKVLQRVALLFTQHFIDLQYYDPDQVFDLLSSFY